MVEDSLSITITFKCRAYERSRYKVFFILLILVSVTSCTKNDEMPPDNLTEREQAIKEYNDNYLGSDISDPGWYGNASTCDAGTVPQSTHDQVTMRINYFRNLVGLNHITLDESQFTKYQETALIMKANNQLSHTPPNTWTCWSEQGSDGASDSNLHSKHSTDGITDFIEDFG